MKRRTLLQALAAALLVRPALPSLAAGQATTPLTEAHVATLRALAEVVLPSALGDAGRAAAVDRFVFWIRDYREGADRGHSYGASTISQVTGPSPALRYPAQFAALDEAAVAHGAPTFASLGPAERKAAVVATLNKGQATNNLPARPNGNSLIADFMGMYFGSEAGYDLAYDAAIGRDTCRGLDDSPKPPAPRGRA